MTDKAKATAAVTTATATPANSVNVSLDMPREEFLGWRQTLHDIGILPRSASHVLQVACGWNHTVVLIGNGDTWGWGSNSRGQLGIAGATTVTSPQRIIVCASSSACAEDSICQSTIGVSAGGSHSLFLFGNGEIFGCGDNRYMQLGTAAAQVSSATSTLATVESPRRVPWMCPHMPIFVECGWQFSAALTHGGLVYTWGDNRKGQCAQQGSCASIAGDVIPTPTRVQFGPEKKKLCITSVSCGWSHMLAMERNGNVYSWGRHDMGQLGVRFPRKPSLIGTAGVFKVKFPLFASPGEHVIKIACGAEHSVAVTSSGCLFTWGWGEHGNLGHGVRSNEWTPRCVKEFGNETGCLVQNVVTGGAAVFAHVLRHTLL